MISSLMGDTVTLIRLAAGGRDKFGKPILTEINRTNLRAKVQRRTSVETGELLTNKWTAYLNSFTVDVRADDVMEHNGQRYYVEGVPERRSVPGHPVLNHTRIELTQRES